MYHPTAEQADADRIHAYNTGVPHGYVAPGDKYKDLPTIELMVVSELHDETEYGSEVDKNGRHHGGPFKIQVSPKMRIEELRRVIYQKGGVIPALQRLSYAGKDLEDSQRTLEHYGIAYWHKKFPHWPLKIRRCMLNCVWLNLHACPQPYLWFPSCTLKTVTIITVPMISLSRLNFTLGN